MTSQSLAASAVEPRLDSRRWIVLAVVVAAQFMVVLDVAIVNVALPSIKTDLGFTQETLPWVVTAYALLFGGVLLLGGRMADLLGLVGGIADHFPRHPGAGRRAPVTGRAVDPDHDLPGRS